jgi:hypothetical protein
MKVSAGGTGAISRDYFRHWTPAYLDIHTGFRGGRRASLARPFLISLKNGGF